MFSFICDRLEITYMYMYIVMVWNYCIHANASQKETFLFMFFFQVWGKFFAALDMFSAEQQLLIPPQVIKQRIFILLINAMTLDIKEKKIDRSVALNIILQLCELIETFVLIIHPSTVDDEG